MPIHAKTSWDCLQVLMQNMEESMYMSPPPDLASPHASATFSFFPVWGQPSTPQSGWKVWGSRGREDPPPQADVLLGLRASLIVICQGEPQGSLLASRPYCVWLTQGVSVKMLLETCDSEEWRQKCRWGSRYQCWGCKCWPRTMLKARTWSKTMLLMMMMMIMIMMTMTTMTKWRQTATNDDQRQPTTTDADRRRPTTTSDDRRLTTNHHQRPLTINDHDWQPMTNDNEDW